MDDNTPSYWTNLCGNNSDYDSFWSFSLTVNTSSPDVTQCFQDTVITWSVCGGFLVISPIYAYYLSTLDRSSRLRRSVLNISKLVLGSLLSLLYAVKVVYCSLGLSDGSVSIAALTAAVLQTLATIAMTSFTSEEFRRRMHTSAVGSIYWLIEVVVGIVAVRSTTIQNEREDTQPPLWSVVCVYLGFSFTLLIFLLTCFADKSVLGRQSRSDGHDTEYTPLINGTPTSPTQDGENCPSLTATFFSRLTFAWFTPFLIRGYKRATELHDLYKLRDSDSTAVILSKFNFYFSDHDSKRTRLGLDRHPTWHLFKCLAMTFKWQMILSYLARTVGIAFQYANPQILGLLIRFIEDNEGYTWQGVGLSSMLLACSVLASLSVHWFQYYGFLTGQHIRTTINGLIYRKALKLSSSARASTTMGEIVNLMSVDSQKLQNVTPFLHLTWSFPLMTALTLYFMYQIVGVAAFAGVAVLVALLPINALFIGNKIRQLQVKQMEAKDSRTRIINEVLAGIKVLKFYAWEPSFHQKICAIRDKELNFLRRGAYYNTINSIGWYIAPYLVSLVVFTTYVMTGNVLTADKAFVTLSLISVLNFPMALLPVGISAIVQGQVSMKRVARFLTLEEIDTKPHSKHQTDLHDDPLAVEITNGTFAWGEQAPTLNNLNLRVKTGSLVALVGQVGSGKSSLISAILGEMRRCQGYYNVEGRIAYVPQQAWIQNATMKDNILFGKDYNSNYDDVIEACALKPDLSILPAGDMTEIGEKGINLSGGQKQRVSLGRAVFQNLDVYIMDDPLSAVDAHVGKHIFEKVIGHEGLLKNKTRLLVTHNVSYLPHVDQIVVMSNGRISEQGTYKELMKDNADFANFLSTYLQQGNEESSDLAESGSISDKMETVPESNRIRLRKRRQSSTRTSFQKSLTKSKDQSNAKENDGQIVSEELAMAGSVSWRAIRTYVRAGGMLCLLAVVIAHVAFITTNVCTNIWLTAWTNDPVYNGSRSKEDVNYRLGVYGAFGCVQLVLLICEEIIVAVGCVRAARTLHSQVLERILRAPMSFFDTTPLGRILNRFTKDLDVVDANLPPFVQYWLYDVAPLVATVAVILYTTPLYIVVLAPVAVLFYLMQKMLVININRLKRLDSVLRSPLYAHFDESVTGLSSIRAYQKVDEFTARCDHLVDNSQCAWYLFIISVRWLGVWTEGIGSVLVFFAALFAVLQRDTLTGGLAGLSVSFALQFTLILNFTVRSSSELETYMVSVERLKEYSEITQEAPWTTESFHTAPGWPQNGRVQLHNYSTRYRPELSLVLKGISCNIPAKERVGVVGRTGAGKSSLTLSLFRIIEAAGGNITIDGADIARLGLHELRKALTIIPQDPVLFCGSLRGNLDPFGKYSDHQIYKSLEYAHLKNFVSELQNGLEYDVGNNGEALSVGQRQLVCLARALLHKTKILILDEATAAVDMETDDLVQHTIRSEFSDCTVITIAHRINTVLDYDRILVFEEGKIVENDSPQNLLRNTTSIFYQMSKDSGIAVEDS